MIPQSEVNPKEKTEDDLLEGTAQRTRHSIFILENGGKAIEQ